MKQAVVLFVSLIGCLNLLATPRIDSARLQFIQPFEKQIFIGPVIRQRTTSFQLTNALNRNNWVHYAPNNAYSAGIRLTLFGIGLEGSMAVPLARRNVERYGSTDIHEFQLNSFTNKWFADFYWQRYDGFYLKRSWAKLGYKEIHPQRNDLSLKNSGISFTYIFNHRHYSMRAAYQFSERQLKSSGSVMVGFIMNRFRISGNDFIIRLEDQPYFTEGSDARSTDFTVASIAAGYGYTLIHKNFFVNVSALAGPSHHWMKYTSAAAHHDTDLNLYATYFAAIGYNGDRSFFGMTFHSKNSSVRMLETSVSSTLNTFRLVAGIRLKERGFLIKRPKDLIQVMGKKNSR